MGICNSDGIRCIAGVDSVAVYSPHVRTNGCRHEVHGCVFLEGQQSGLVAALSLCHCRQQGFAKIIAVNAYMTWMGPVAVYSRHMRTNRCRHGVHGRDFLEGQKPGIHGSSFSVFVVQIVWGRYVVQKMAPPFLPFFAPLG